MVNDLPSRLLVVCSSSCCLPYPFSVPPGSACTLPTKVRPSPGPARSSQVQPGARLLRPCPPSPPLAPILPTSVAAPRQKRNPRQKKAPSPPISSRPCSTLLCLPAWPACLSSVRPKPPPSPFCQLHHQKHPSAVPNVAINRRANPRSHPLSVRLVALEFPAATVLSVHAIVHRASQLPTPCFFFVVAVVIVTYKHHTTHSHLLLLHKEPIPVHNLQSAVTSLCAPVRPPSQSPSLPLAVSQTQGISKTWLHNPILKSRPTSASCSGTSAAAAPLPLLCSALRRRLPFRTSTITFSIFFSAACVVVNHLAAPATRPATDPRRFSPRYSLLCFSPVLCVSPRDAPCSSLNQARLRFLPPLAAHVLSIRLARPVACP